jgi:Tat protein translocase TatC
MYERTIGAPAVVPPIVPPSAIRAGAVPRRPDGLRAAAPALGARFRPAPTGAHARRPDGPDRAPAGVPQPARHLPARPGGRRRGGADLPSSGLRLRQAAVLRHRGGPGGGRAAGGECNLFAFGAFEQFSVSLRVSLIVGVLASSPVWLYQFGAFITPALHRKEKRYAAAFLTASLILFCTGTTFAFLTISRGLQFLLTFGGDGIVTLPSIQSYLSFVTLTLLGFGIAFLFPVVVIFLNIVGAFRRPGMRSWRPRHDRRASPWPRRS